MSAIICLEVRKNDGYLRAGNNTFVFEGMAKNCDGSASECSFKVNGVKRAHDAILAVASHYDWFDVHSVRNIRKKDEAAIFNIGDRVAHDNGYFGVVINDFGFVNTDESRVLVKWDDGEIRLVPKCCIAKFSRKEAN